MSLRSDFPVFSHHPDLVYLDSASTAQKPRTVIDAMKTFLEQDYANIHRGSYNLSERSEVMYHTSKEAVCRFLNAEHASEIVYTYSATYAFNLLALSLRKSGWLRKGDRVLLSVAEHHANVVPWLIAKEELGIEVDFVGLDSDFNLDYGELERKLTPDVRVVSLTAMSNVTGGMFDLTKASQVIRGRAPNALFVVDGSQAFPHFATDVRAIDADFFVFTGHKVMSDTGLGILYGKKNLLKALTPAFGGGGAINWVKKECFMPAGLPSRFEPGTPHIVGAVSLLAALEYIESIGGYPTIEQIEHELIEHTLEKWQDFSKKFPQVRLLGKPSPEGRGGVFSFAVEGIHPVDLADAFAEENICVRAGHHCAEPLAESLGVSGSLRMSCSLYNTPEDIDRFFEVFTEILS